MNNAGILERQMKVESMTAERVLRVLATNVVGSFLARAKRFSGCPPRTAVVAEPSSTFRPLRRAWRSGEYVDYAASKGAIDTLTVGLARELAGEGIRVNAVRPGIIDTEIHASGGDADRAARKGKLVPVGRAGRADEVASAILWLLSTEASYVTGSVLDVTGGR